MWWSGFLGVDFHIRLKIEAKFFVFESQNRVVSTKMFRDVLVITVNLLHKTYKMESQ